MKVAALFVRADSIYKTLPGVDAFDIERDARSYSGSMPVVAHPPCRAWGSLRFFANPEPGERELAFFAVDAVRRCGGVLEHPQASILWPEYGLPEVGRVDDFGGWTLPVYQHWFGHRAEKKTKLYIVGCSARSLPDFPLVLGDAPRVLFNRRGVRSGMPGFKTECTKAEREATPEPFARWLVDLASRCAR